MKITKQMIDAVLHAMQVGIQAKGAPNKMLTQEAIEEIMFKQGITFFVPVRTTISGLIQKGLITYFQLNNGRLMFGFTKTMQEKAFPPNFTATRSTGQPIIDMESPDIERVAR